MKKTAMAAVVMAGWLTACERETNVKIPAHESKLVVHGQQAQNQFFSVRVGRSLGITEPLNGQNAQSFDVLHALVRVKQNDAVVDTLRYAAASSSYEGKRARALLGYTYTVEVSAPGFAAATGTGTFPDPVQPLSVGLRRNVRLSQDGDPLDEVTVTFRDRAAQTDYYLFRIRRAGGEFADCVITSDKDVERLVYSDPFYTGECLRGSRLLVSDKNFDGSTKTLVFYVETDQMGEIINAQGRRLRPTIDLLHINEDYFRYLKSVNAYRNAVDNPFAEPVNVVTNIQNGYGFFTTFALAVDSL